MINSTHLKNIKRFALLSAIVPFITINLCVLLTNYLSTFGDQIKVESINGKTIDHSKDYFEMLCNEKNNFCNDNKILTNNTANCSLLGKEYRFTLDGERIHFEFKNNGTAENSNKDIKIIYSIYINESKKLFNEKELKSYLRNRDIIFNENCVNNFKFLDYLYNSFPVIDKIHVKRTSSKNPDLLVRPSIPYIDGQISISRAARNYPTNIIFKSLMIPTSFFMFFFWLNNNKNFNFISNKKVNRSFLIFGTISAVCLLFHSIFLGIKIDFSFYEKLRKLNLIMFIFCEVIAQFLYLKTMYKMKNDVIKTINPKTLLLKLIYIILIISLTLILMLVFIFIDTTGKFNNMVEWNYFSIALVFYLLCFFLWRETPNHTPRGV